MKIDIRSLFPPGADEDTPVFVISVAAQLSGLHAQRDVVEYVRAAIARGKTDNFKHPLLPDRLL